LGDDASIYYNGTNLIIDPKEVGSGSVDLNGGSLTTTGTLVSGAATIDSTLVLSSGSITDSGGAIDFGDENLTTTGTLVSGAATIDNFVLSSGTQYSSAAGTTAISLFKDRIGDGTSGSYLNGAGVEFFKNADGYTSHNHADNENPTLRFYGATSTGQKYGEIGVDDYSRLKFDGTVNQTVFGTNVTIDGSLLQFSGNVRAFFGENTQGNDHPVFGGYDHPTSDNTPIVVMTDYSRRNLDFSAPANADPQLWLHSGSATAANLLKLYHDDTDSIIHSNAGDLKLSAAGGDIDCDDENVITTGYISAEHIKGLERGSDPTEPSEGEFVVWMSDGTGKGDDGDIMVASQAGGTTNYGTLFDHSGGGGWDIAEYYGSFDETLEAGDIVAIDEDYNSSGVKSYVKKSSEPYEDNIIGVVSTKPYKTFGDVFEESENPVPIGLAGRVIVKVSTENGNIEIGDRLTSSSVAGTAMKATQPGSVIGRALESFGQGGSDNPEQGKVLAYIDNSWYGGSLERNGVLEGSSINLSGGDSNFVKKLVSSLEYFGIIIRNGFVQVKELMADKVTATFARFERAEIEKLQMKDHKTGEVYCTWIENGEWQKVKGPCEDSNNNKDIGNMGDNGNANNTGGNNIGEINDVGGDSASEGTEDTGTTEGNDNGGDNTGNTSGTGSAGDVEDNTGGDNNDSGTEDAGSTGEGGNDSDNAGDTDNAEETGDSIGEDAGSTGESDNAGDTDSAGETGDSIGEDAGNTNGDADNAGDTGGDDTGSADSGSIDGDSGSGGTSSSDSNSSNTGSGGDGSGENSSSSSSSSGQTSGGGDSSSGGSSGEAGGSSSPSGSGTSAASGGDSSGSGE